jgi:hypothetical protein
MLRATAVMLMTTAVMLRATAVERSRFAAGLDD